MMHGEPKARVDQDSSRHLAQGAVPAHQGVEHIHQIFINKAGSLPSSLPDSIIANAESVKALYPDARYALYCGDELRDLIGRNFDPEVLNSYDTLVPYAYKCDLARLCVLYMYGGLYIDLGVRLFYSLEITGDTKTLFFRCPLHRDNHSWDVENSLMYVPPARKEIATAIDIICSNVRRRFYGVNTLAPTGPGVLGRALAIVGAEEDYAMGFSSVSNTPLKHNFFNYILPSGKFVATRSKDGRLDVVIKDANDYNNYWHGRIVYGEDVVFRASDFASTHELSESDSGATRVFRAGNVGCVIWGPYRFVPRGRYQVTLTFSEGTQIPDMRIDFYDRGLGVLLEDTLWNCDSPTKSSRTLEFCNPFDSRLLEVRLHSGGRSTGGLRSVTLRPVGEETDLSFSPRHFSSKSKSGDVVHGADPVALPRSLRGCIVWGPYKHLAEGRYRAEIRFADGTDFTGLSLDFFDIGIGVLHEEALAYSNKENGYTCVIDFACQHDCAKFEVRVHSIGKSKGGALVSVLFRRIPETLPLCFHSKDFELDKGSSITTRGGRHLIAFNQGAPSALSTRSRRTLHQGEYKVSIALSGDPPPQELVLEVIDSGLGVLAGRRFEDMEASSIGVRSFVFANGWDARNVQLRLRGRGTTLLHLDIVSIERIA